MGMFDYAEKYDINVSPFERAQQKAHESREVFYRDTLDPMVEQLTGYVDPKVKMQREVAGVDLSNIKEVQTMFQKLMAKNPAMANKWRESVMPIVEQNMEVAKLLEVSKKNRGNNLTLKTVANPNNPDQTMEALIDKTTGISTPVTSNAGQLLIQNKFSNEGGDPKILNAYKAIEREYNASFCAGGGGGPFDKKVCSPPNPETQAALYKKWGNRLPTLKEFFADKKGQKGKHTGSDIYNSITGGLGMGAQESQQSKYKIIKK